MQTIQAKVNPRLLTKADRLFTGTLEGRIIELLQNARRAGATRVEITNSHPGNETDAISDGGADMNADPSSNSNQVTVRDNGRGIDDFARLLDLGASGWDADLEHSEDPAGVGFFCLAPREVSIRSNGRRLTLTADGWTGAAVAVLEDQTPIEGVSICFHDEPWTKDDVEPHAVFTGMQITVNGEECASAPFNSPEAVHDSELGCRIEIRSIESLEPRYLEHKRRGRYDANVLINFHGQVTTFSHHPISEQGLCYLVELTGQPTGIRLMLPARTRLVENGAFKQLLSALELEGFRFVAHRGKHTLPYKEYLRARELGVELPEAEPDYTVGLLRSGEMPEPIEMTMPKDFPLSSCYRLDPQCEKDDETTAANAHLLAALGKFETPFAPVEIRSCYDGYSWAGLPVIQKVELTQGRKLLEEVWIWSGKLTCVESLTLTAHTGDGRVFSSAVCMARMPEAPTESLTWSTGHMLLTPQARERLRPSEIWYHLGGWSDEGDTYETQQHDFEQALDRFWARLIGPDEHLRREIVTAVDQVGRKWKRAEITRDGVVSIQFVRGRDRILTPPA